MNWEDAASALLHGLLLTLIGVMLHGVIAIALFARGL